MKKSILLYVALAVLYAVPFMAFFLFIGKGDTNGRFYDETTFNNATVVIDTTDVNAPTATSELFLGVDTIRLERADNYGIKEKNEKRNETIKLPASNETVFKSDKEQFTSDTASYGQVTSPMSHIADTSDMVEVLLPRVQRKYEDSTCTVWVSGHNPTVDSVWVYNKKVYYPVVREKEPKPPRVVVSIGPYVGFGNKGANYGVAISVGIPIWSW